MFRTIGDGPSLWEARLPPELLRLPDDLARVDALLDDPAFFAPFAPFFHPVLGRPSTPVECHLRPMFLKFRHRPGFESVCAEVADSISWLPLSAPSLVRAAGEQEPWPRQCHTHAGSLTIRHQQ